MLSLSLLAEGRLSSRLLDDPNFWFGVIGLAGALIAGAVVFYFLDRWWKRGSTAATRDAGSELTSFRAMYERGEITEEEYTKLRRKVADRVKTTPTPAPTHAPVADAAGTGPATGGTPTPRPGSAVPGPFPPGYFDDPPGLNGSAPSPNGMPPGGPTPPA